MAFRLKLFFKTMRVFPRQNFTFPSFSQNSQFHLPNILQNTKLSTSFLNFPSRTVQTTAKDSLKATKQPSVKDAKGRFTNPWSTWEKKGFKDIIKFLKSSKRSQLPPKEILDETLPILKPNMNLLHNPSPENIQLVWIGHATVFVQFDGITFLTDPIWSNHCGPISLFGPKRYRSPPLSIEELPKIDIAFISHTHYDHMDYDTIKKLGNKTKWYVPLGVKEWFQSCGITNCEEFDWWQEKEIQHKDQTFKIVFTPSQHWCKRTLIDDNKSLWGSWLLIGPSKRKFYFAGDTGYCPIFVEIGKEYGPIDLAAIPIGGYEPRWFMRPQHVNPEEAVQIHKDIQAQKSIGIHWATFPLTNEPYLDPLKKMSESLKQENLPQDAFFALKHGELKIIPNSNKNSNN